MKTLLFADNTLPLPVGAVCDLVNRTCQTIQMAAGQTKIRIAEPAIVAPQSLRKVQRAIAGEVGEHDYAFVCTAVPYENNHFFDSVGSTILISFSDWNLLTELPIANGVLYFVASILCDLPEDSSHEENTGCVNDYLWDKRGVNVGMRAAFVCAECRRRFVGDKAILADAERLLNLVSAASRAGRDVITLDGSSPRSADAGFDVFLCHNSDDKPAVREINTILKSAGIRTWFDEEQLQPGQMWQPELERQISEVRAACVFVGPNGRGPWQDAEIRSFLGEFVNRECRVIPVLLKGADTAPNLPLFLKQMVWVDLRRKSQVNLAKLIAALIPRPGP